MIARQVVDGRSFGLMPGRMVEVASSGRWTGFGGATGFPGATGPQARKPGQPDGFPGIVIASVKRKPGP